ncbi:MAG: 16S rRNA (guanine(527)-N(7))-methyltransferase RsmG [Pseudomonadota bacterium]
MSPATLKEAWRRHVMDSAQLFPLGLDNARLWTDLGSGGGFPGLVVAILAQQLAPELRLRLVEADRRKTVFLAEAARRLDLSVDIQCRRIEAAAPRDGDVISARALAPLPKLLTLAVPQARAPAIFLFPKGRKAQDELTAARRHWHMDVVAHPSATDPESVILEIRNVRSRTGPRP